MIEGAYELRLRCDFDGCRNGLFKLSAAKAEFEGPRSADCRRKARRAGWQLSQRDRTAYCVVHNNARKRSS